MRRYSMEFTGWQLIWLFFCYSFLGWVLETVSSAIRQKRFVNRGLINGPFCVLYGTAAVIMTVVLGELHGFWLFVGCLILSTLLEWTAGHLIEKMYHETWWDYSGVRWNLDGYICLSMSLLWGVLGFAALNWGNTLLLALFQMLPALAGKVLNIILLLILGVDVLATLMILSGRSRRIQQWEAADAWLTGISSGLQKKIYTGVDRRLQRAYPKKQRLAAEEKDKTVFASGCDFYKIVCLFLIGAFLGDITETIFCRITAGVWMSRSSVVWGPFSIVWGLAIGAATLLLYKYKDSSDGFIFLVGTLLGGAYEYVCSVFTEIVFGTVFWDYSQIPFNLGGRINLLYCFFWGIAAVVWIKKLYPVFSGLIEKIPVKTGKIMTWILIAFMSCNIIVSCMALVRYNQRSSGIPADSGWQKEMDERFDDARMEHIYPNALKVNE